MHRIVTVALLAGAVSAGKLPAAVGATAFPAIPVAASIATVRDTFPHARHQKLACLTCHLSTSQAMLKFEPPRGCQNCHHQNPAKADCAHCHEPASLPETLAVNVAIAAAGKPLRERTVGFRHERHASLRCTDCHGQPVTMIPLDSVVTCHGCHARHHEAGRNCAVCHRSSIITEVHAPPVRVHVSCDACHATATIARLTPTRSLCLVCHGAQVDHQPGAECATCHLQASPEDYRARLLRRARPG